MAMDPDIRIKLRHFWQKYNKIIILLAFAIILIIVINRILILNKNPDEPETSYTPNVSVLDDSSEVPDEVADSFEEFIENYVNYCNNGDYVSAYNLVSDDCKQNFFGNSYNNFVEYVSEKFGTGKRYSIQNYSNTDDTYIYSVKIFEDFLASGLTNQSYRYVEEKMAVSYDDNGDIVFSVGNYMGSKTLQYQASNEYLKAEITKSIQKYSFIVYTLKLTNRTDYTIVIRDGNADSTEIYMAIGSETRSAEEDETSIVLEPGEVETVSISFAKFYDSELEPEGIVLNAVRVMENYTGDSETAEEEIENAIDKFSMTIAF